jgi:UDP-N-acetylglucosamine--N-acetylmuramyl-(pentapeptide) pyrophosphoryl-undecaprenol N-acetylglucosamine transferase
MPRRIEAADLILARSGASTVAELAAAAKPSLLVPFPQAADDHQRKNAEVLASAGAAEVMLERELTPEALEQALIRLLSDRPDLEKMSVQARQLAHPDATSRIAAMVMAIAR